MASRSQKTKAARTATPTTTTSTTQDVFAALMAQAKGREAEEARAARASERAAKAALIPAPAPATPDQVRAALEFRANGGTRGIARAHQERETARRVEAQETAARTAWAKTPAGLAALEAIKAKKMGAENMRRAQRDAWLAHVLQQQKILRKQDLIETIAAAERGLVRLAELGALPSYVLLRHEEEVRGLSQLMEASFQAARELAALEE